jgi:GalNAc-alpha-(1->4)-GalNAc-alpha-(1->3)-diNAcBac-PP-undecaprenol alpha-1,4-N-acetyl-D-galactosaminyltransferase
LNSKKPVKIVFIIPSLQSGGMERVMSQLLFYFSKHSNCELHVILYGIDRGIFYDIPTNVVLHQPSFKFNNKLRLWSTLKTLFYIRKTFKKIKPYSILSFGEYWNNFVLLASLGLSLPVYVSDRSQPNKSLGKLHDFLRKCFYRYAKGIIAQTSKAKSIYEAGLVNNLNIKVIGNPIAQQELVTTPREKIVLSVGRLIETKHHDELIKLFVKLNKPDWKLIIVGGDALRQNNMETLNKLITSLNAQNIVTLSGNQKDIASYYKKSSIFAFTSSSEGFPNVVGEALSFGLPVVAFDCIAGPSDMIQESKNGNLIKLFDYKEFADKLSLLIDDTKLRNKMTEFAPSSIKKFENNVISREYFKFITQH